MTTHPSELAGGVAISCESRSGRQPDGRVIQLIAFLTELSLAPSILIMIMMT